MNFLNLVRSRGVTLAGAGLIAVAALVQSGCVAVVAAGAGAGTIAYLRGDLETTVSAGLDRAARAAGVALDQLKFARISQNQDALQAILVARNAADKRIEVRLERAGDNLTKVKIRVGVFGDETVSIAILDKIKASL
ncbi:MAG: DUF3568 family protein [Verrucomicrobia bacterium]|nr:DUF3568 family protein [Verrucomicrobiota bacterium]